MIHFHLTYLYMETIPKLYLNQTLSETLEREIMNGLLLAHNINSFSNKLEFLAAMVN